MPGLEELGIQRWPHQEYVLQEIPRLINAGEKKILVTTPTGGGKSISLCDLIDWGVENGMDAILYTNRKLLINQLGKVLNKRGIHHGVRASGHQDQRQYPVQISSLPTERQRVLNSDKWTLHGTVSGRQVLALIDESHINAGSTAQQILQKHIDAGGVYVGFTATPINLGRLYDRLVIAGTCSELRQCGALVPAYHFSPDEPDMARYKQSVKTGEYKKGDITKAVMTKQIFANVFDWYKRINNEQRPTILFAPGVRESIWFAKEFSKRGVSTAHIDGEGIWYNGEYQRGTDRDWVLDAVRRGDIKILSNRFVAREGLDLPEVSHIIIATVFGGLQSYLQACGRGTRASPGKDRVTIQDHGGHDHRHGSINADRKWLLEYTETMIRGLRMEALRDKEIREPIVCPNCRMVRASGAICPGCGQSSTKQSRFVMMPDGILKERTGDIYKKRHTSLRSDTEELWRKMYYRSRRAGRTFNAAAALFMMENHYYPPRNLPFMPKAPLDFFRKVKDVKAKDLYEGFNNHS